MATIQVADGGMPLILGAILNGASFSGDFHYRLYSNDFTPVPASVVGDFTESTAPGYLSQSVTSSGWTSTLVATGHTKATNADISYTISGSATFYGYYVQDNSNNLVWSQRFDTTITFGALGGIITLTPTFELKTPLP